MRRKVSHEEIEPGLNNTSSMIGVSFTLISGLHSMGIDPADLNMTSQMNMGLNPSIKSKTNRTNPLSNVTALYAVWTQYMNPISLQKVKRCKRVDQGWKTEKIIPYKREWWWYGGRLALSILPWRNWPSTTGKSTRFRREDLRRAACFGVTTSYWVLLCLYSAVRNVPGSPSGVAQQ